MAWLGGSEYLDTLVRNYLIFRGFNNTAKTMDADLKIDKDKGFRVDRIMQHIISYIYAYDIDSLKSYWTHLDSRFFCRFAKSHQQSVEKFKTCLYRLYVVHAIQKSKIKEAHDFFEKMSSDIINSAEWKEWFALPYIQSPDSNPTFSLYFTQQWAETFLISLHNFLASIFSCMPEPAIVKACVADGAQLQELEKENRSLRKKVSTVSGVQQDSPVFRTPKYVEAMGIPGALYENTVPEHQPKKKPIFGFVTRQSSGTTPPKASVSIPKQTDQGNSVNGADIPKKSVFEKETKTLKHSKFEAQRRELMATTKKTQSGGSLKSSSNQSMSNSALAVTDLEPVNAIVQQPSAIFSDEVTNTNADFNNAEKFPSDYPVESDARIVNEDLISYDNEIMLAHNGKDLTAAPVPAPLTSASTAVDEFVASYDFVNNLHKMSVNSQKQLSGQNSVKVSSISGSTYQLNNPVVSKTTYDIDEKPFLVLSKDVFLEHHSGISQCRFNSTGTTIASIDRQGVVKVWQNEPRISTLATVMFHSPIQCLEWCCKPDNILLLGTASGSVRFFNTTSSLSQEDVAVDESYPWVTSIATHPTGTSFVCSCVRPSIDSKKFLSATNHGILLIWNIRGNQVKLDHVLRRRGTSCEITCMEYNHNGNLLVAGDCQGCVTLHEMKSYETLCNWTAHHGSVLCLQFSYDETLIYSLGKDGQFLAWNVHRPCEKPIRFTIKQSPSRTIIQIPIMDKSLQKQKLFSLDPDGKHVLVASGNKGLIYKIDVTEKNLIQVLMLPEHKAPVTAVDWTSSKTCGHCLTGSSDGKVQVTTLLMQ